MEKYGKLGNEKIVKLLFEFSVPAVIAGIIAALYTVIDRIFIGRFVGEMEFSGVSATFPIMIFYIAFASLIGIGASANISLNLGRGNKKRAEHILGNAFTCFNILGVIIIILNYIFLDQILYAFGVTENTFVYARSFMIYLIPTCYMTFLTYGFAGVIRAEGNPKTAMNINIIGALINIILDPLFIIVFKMGVEGAAIATLISNIAAALLVIYHFTYSKKSSLKIKRKYFKLNARILNQIVKIGISPFILQVSLCLVGLAANNMIKIYGNDFDFGIYGVLNTYLIVIFSVVLGISQGAQPIIGYNYGLKNYKRVEETLLKSISFTTVFSILCLIITLIFSKELSGIFVKDEMLISRTAPALILFLLSLPLYGILIIGVDFFQVVEEAKTSSVLFFLRHFLLALGSMFLLPVLMGINGVWLSRTISDYIYLPAVLYFQWKWMKKLKLKIEQQNESEIKVQISGSPEKAL
jgi:putative MATE family efflux protein